MKRNWYRKGDVLKEEIRLTETSENELALWNIGQCGYILKHQNIVIYIDPVLNDITGSDGMTRRWYQPPFAPFEAKADYIICTHGHDDHLAEKTVAGICSANPDCRVIVPGGCLPILDKIGIPKDRQIGAADGEPILLEELTILPAATAHPEHVWDEEGRDLSLAYQLDFDSLCVLHLGDTYLTDRLYQSLIKMKRPDIYFAPINGSDYFRTARNCIGNMEAEEAARLAISLKADLAIPMHYDMMYGNTVDPYRFCRVLDRECSEMKVQLPRLGERVIYRK